MKTNLHKMAFGLLFLINFAFGQTLVAHYPLDGNANEASTHCNNGTVYGSLSAFNSCNVANTAMSFNGTNNYIEAAYCPSLAVSTELTLCAWVKFNGWYNGSCQSNHVVQKGQDVKAGSFMLSIEDDQDCFAPLNVNTERVDFSIWTDNAGGREYVYGNQNLVLNQWYFIVGTYSLNTGQMRLYLNGVLDNIKSNINIVIPQNVQNLSIGGMLDNGNLSYPVNGYIDDVRIYNFALTSQEIQDIYDQHCWATAIENEVQNVVKLFPNPASEMLQIEWNTIQPEKIAIIDFTGKIVLQKELETSKQNTNLDVSNLAKGMYLVKIVGKEGEYSQKFVKE